MAFIHLPYCFLNWVLVIIVCFSKAEGCVETERLALLDFKKSFSPFPQNNGKLSSWNISSEECCIWEGIQCEERDSRVHVVELDLSYQGLQSHQLRPSLLELQHLDTLYLNENNFPMRVPEFIGSFRNLSYLDLSNSGFFGSLPPQLGNLSSLGLLAVGSIDFVEAKEWLSVITKLPALYDFTCYSCSFPAPDLLPTIHFNSSSSLQALRIFDGVISTSTLSLFLSTNPSDLTLESVHLEGLSLNIFDQIGKLCNLDTLSMSSCSIKEDISGVLQALGAGCATDSLKWLDLRSNNLTGFIPSMLKFRSLGALSLDDNQLEGFASHISSTNATLFRNTPHIFPATLSLLSVSDNTLNGVLLDEYFANIPQLYLETLDLSNNPNLAVSFNKPPGAWLLLRSCNLGPIFPTWLLASLEGIVYLDISDSNLSGFVPTTFWRNLPSSISYLNLSSNNLLGVIPNSFPNLTGQGSVIDLSSNSFYGPLPLTLFKATQLNLSKNNFSSFAPLPHTTKFTSPRFKAIDVYNQAINMLDISDNKLSGEIPDWAWLAISRFNTINLSNNNLSGKIPSSYTANLYVLNLRNNRFVGQIPSFLKNSASLRILDLSRNRLSGLIPSWIGEGLDSLVVLSLQSNNFTGTLPRKMCHLRSLQILDLSHNTLSGTIPSCVDNFVAMARFLNLSTEGYGVAVSVPRELILGSYVREVMSVVEAEFYQALIKWKGMDRLFHKNLELLNLIDLSYNNFSGEIPGELMSLMKLYSIDLSSNNFIGSIPNHIGQLKDLEYLNLSFNSFSGPIPTGLADITALDVLDLSHNDLSGRIPKGPQLQGFDSSSFTANSQLCGEPLEVKCPGDADDSTQPLQSPAATTHEGDEWEDKQWFYAGSGAGFACGFLGVIATLTWIRHAFFWLATELGEWVLLVVALGASRISRKLRFK